MSAFEFEPVPPSKRATINDALESLTIEDIVDHKRVSVAELKEDLFNLDAYDGQVNYQYTWADYRVRIVTEIESLEQSFDMQQWCIDHLGDRWATTPPGVDSQEWYFVDEKDALLFRLKWL